MIIQIFGKKSIQIEEKSVSLQIIHWGSTIHLHFLPATKVQVESAGHLILTRPRKKKGGRNAKALSKAMD